MNKKNETLIACANRLYGPYFAAFMVFAILGTAGQCVVIVISMLAELIRSFFL